MRLRADFLEYWEGEASITTDHAASSYGQPVLVIEGVAVGTLEAQLMAYEILDATIEERALLESAGYELAGL
ncbi:MAG: hypothetical protein JRJ77_03950 [Deltaproteobacteria bacterium]|nr:hypothetical protein [Deltaproteobacteria bacterium]